MTIHIVSKKCGIIKKIYIDEIENTLKVLHIKLCINM